MTVQLRHELAELAEGARSYADMDTVIDRARRLRRRRALVPSATVALAALAVVVWIAVPAPTDTPPSSETVYPELPRLVEPPTEPPPLLPADRAVGPAALAYQCRGCPAYLVMPDGSHYQLEDYAGLDGGREVALSPDGRWLGLATAEGFLVRDLTSTAHETYDGFGSVAWSPNSRFLVGYLRNSNNRYAVVDTTTGELERAEGTSGLRGMVPRVLDSGELVALDEESYSLRFLDPDTGDLREIDTGIQPYDGASPSALSIGGDLALAMFIRIDGDAVEPAGAQVISLADGELVSRVDAPESAHFWYADRLAGRLLRTVELVDPVGIWEVSAHDLDSGGTELASRLAIDGFFVLRGGATWLSDLPETGS